MELYHYINTAGQRFPLPERPSEPPDCWEKEEYDEWGDEEVDHKN